MTTEHLLSSREYLSTASPVFFTYILLSLLGDPDHNPDNWLTRFIVFKTKKDDIFHPLFSFTKMINGQQSKKDKDHQHLLEAYLMLKGLNYALILVDDAGLVKLPQYNPVLTTPQTLTLHSTTSSLAVSPTMESRASTKTNLSKWTQPSFITWSYTDVSHSINLPDYAKINQHEYYD